MTLKTLTTAPQLAVAVFVKTPGLSPVKTRLAQSLGQDIATQFYQLSCSAVAAVLESLSRAPSSQIQAYWAVAEEEADVRSWPQFEILKQGEGGLGDRLAKVYAVLGETQKFPTLIGADTPQISAQHFTRTASMLDEAYDFVMGPAADGGFFLFAGKKPLPKVVWTEIAYSTNSTAQALVSAVQAFGKVGWLEPLTDADEAQDLPTVAAELLRLSDRLPEQQALYEWLCQKKFAGM